MSLSSEPVSEAWLMGISQEHLDMRNNGFGSRTEPVGDYGDYEDPEFGDIQVKGEITLPPEIYEVPRELRVGQSVVELVN